MAYSEKIIKETVEANPAYLLENNNAFALTEYKVLNGRNRKHLIKCYKVMYNGKIQLIYLVSGYRPLAGLIETIDPDELCIIITNLIKAIIYIEEIGFLKCNNLDISFNNLFVDMKTYEVNLVYLPVNNKKQDIIEYETKFINYISTQLDKIETVMPGKTSEIRKYFSGNKSSLRRIYDTISADLKKKKTPIPGIAKEVPGSYSNQPVLTMTLEGEPEGIVFFVDKQQFTIGKRTGVDGLMTFNNAISRHHCDIIYRDMKYFVIDMGSSNGTFVNGARLVPKTPKEIKDGDIMRLANSNFKIQIREGF